MTERKKTYTIGSPEGSTFAQQAAEPGTPAPAVGDTVQLHLDDAQELALLAAGWLTTENTDPKGGSK